jgi:hypothetical protein
MIKTPLLVITETRNTFRNKKRWCKNFYAIDEEGKYCAVFNDRAVARCLYGQVRYHTGQEYPVDRNVLNTISYVARKLWRDRPWSNSEWDILTRVNDDLGYPGVMVLLNTTIAYLEGRVMWSEEGQDFRNVR